MKEDNKSQRKSLRNKTSQKKKPECETKHGTIDPFSSSQVYFNLNWK
jgi:hypothetical protein